MRAGAILEAGAVEPAAGADRFGDFLVFHTAAVQIELVCLVDELHGSRAVAPGGTFLLVGHDLRNLDEGYGGPRDPAVLYRPEDVVAALDGRELGGWYT